MNDNQLDIKSLRSYGIHGALGLLMGIGAGYIFYMIAALTSVISSQLIRVLFAFLIIYGLFGLYAGYIFGGEKKSTVISRTYAIAGIVGGLVIAFILVSEFSNMNGLLDPLFVSMIFAGPILGFPKIKNMVIMTISCSSGAALGYGINVYAQNSVVYSVWTQIGLYALFIGIPMLAIGIAGASIAIGMYFTGGRSYTAKEIPWFLKIIRGAGIVLTFIMLFFSTVLFLAVENYATTDVSIDISSSDGNTTVLIPVILENGFLMEMYRNPEILGSATAEIIDTDHGKAFKISGSGPIKIKMKQTGGWLSRDPESNERFNGFTLSTSNVTGFVGRDDSIGVWIFSEEDGIMLSISIGRDNGRRMYRHITTQRMERLTAGWQEVKLSVLDMTYD